MEILSVVFCPGRTTGGWAAKASIRKRLGGCAGWSTLASPELHPEMKIKMVQKRTVSHGAAASTLQPLSPSGRGGGERGVPAVQRLFSRKTAPVTIVRTF